MGQGAYMFLKQEKQWAGSDMGSLTDIDD